VIRVFSGNLAEGIAFEQARQWIIDGLKTASREAEKSGVTLCLENHGKLAGKADQIKTLLDRVDSPALRSTFDTGNFLLADEHPLDALRLLAPYIGHVHVKDFKEQGNGKYKSIGMRTYEGVPAGEGDASLPDVLDSLQAGGYTGAVVLEFEGIGDEADGIRQSFERLRTMLDKEKEGG
jgi:sugar phosphate isomerase/epimerase